jgi:aquaporin Z
MSALSRKITVEFIGTFLLMFTVGMAVATAGPLAAVAIGGVIVVLVFAGGHISGGHYNPAISTAVMLRGRLPVRDWSAYVAAQLVAAVLAGLLVSGLDYGPAAATAVAGSGAMLVVEFLFTFALCYVVLNVATAKDTESNSFYGLAIGFTVLAGILATGSVSGGAFNPAVALGGSVLGVYAWSHIWIYLLAEIVGAAVAAGAFLLTQPAEESDAQRSAAAPHGQITQPSGNGASHGAAHASS